MGARNFYPGNQTEHSSSSSTEVKNAWRSTFSSPYILIRHKHKSYRSFILICHNNACVVHKKNWLKKGESIAAEHKETHVNNNLSISRFGLSLSLSSGTAAAFPKGKYRLGHVWCILLAYSLSCRGPADVQQERRAKHTFERRYRQDWHIYIYIYTGYWNASKRTQQVVWEEEASLN